MAASSACCLLTSAKRSTNSCSCPAMLPTSFGYYTCCRRSSGRSPEVTLGTLPLLVMVRAVQERRAHVRRGAPHVLVLLEPGVALPLLAAPATPSAHAAHRHVRPEIGRAACRARA